MSASGRRVHRHLVLSGHVNSLDNVDLSAGSHR